ncbi:ComEC/Rec2 family competence protein [Daejeonella sp.]|uniref:ComEC/Rec2 family competence protein n=1 Tax=Daejeonella sp. TaxID=2805397 RepID=UPI0025BC51F0|nr:ComEC/Rec2 family competence protein [Daejeonella sp.]
MIFKGEVPFVRLLIPLIIGIIIASYFPSSFIYSWAIIFLISILISYLLLLKLYKKHRLFRFGWVFGILIHGFLALLSYSLAVHYSGTYDTKYYSAIKSEMLFLKIINEPKTAAGIVRFEAEVPAIYFNNSIQSSTGKLLVAIKIDSLKNRSFYYGDLLLVPSNFKEIEAPYNPGEFDYKSYLKNKQIYYQQFVDLSQVKKVAEQFGNPIIFYALSLRKKLVQKFVKYIPDEEASSLASALILGYRAELSNDLVEAYSKTGTMHVLSVSGMHVGIVFLVLTFFLKAMNKNRQLILIRAIIIIGVIWFYSLLTGFSPSVCRSALMLSFVVLGKAINKNQNTYNLMAISAFFLLLYDPFYLFDVGFQLSYLAVAGLVYFHPIIYNSFYIKNKILDYLWSYSALSLAAQVATFPISVYYFHQFPIYFLLSNLLIVLPVAIIMYVGIAFLFMPFEILNKLFGTFLNYLINFTNNILYKIENLPFSALEGLWISAFELLFLFLIIILFILWHTFRNKSVVWLALVNVFFLSISFSFKSIQNFTRHELVFFSLRKNTAIAYINQGRAIVISDIDSLDKLINYSIKPFFTSRGLKEIKYINFEKHLQKESYYLATDFMQFGNFRVLRWKNEFNELALSNKIDVDIVLVQKNIKNINLINLKNRVNFKTLIFESKIPDYKINKYLEEARKLNINCISLQKKSAYIVKM